MVVSKPDSPVARAFVNMAEEVKALVEARKAAEEREAEQAESSPTGTSEKADE